MDAIQKNKSMQKPRLLWHGWIFGGIFLVYSIAAAVDYVMSLYLGESYYRASGMTEAQITYFLSVPYWAIGGWTFAVWGGLFGSVALLFLGRFASTLFASSLLGGVIYILHVLVLSDGRQAMGVLWLMPIVIAVITCGMIFYSKHLRR